MEPALKHRLIGAAVISALAIIFLPMLIVGNDPNASVSKVPLKAPAAPAGNFQTKELPLVTPPPNVPAGGVVGMNASPAASPMASSVASPMASPASPAAPTPAASPSVIASPASPAAVPVVPASGKAPPPAASPAGIVAAAASPASPAALPEPPPIPAANAGGRYVVSLGTYANAANAQALVNSLKARQIPAYSETVTMAGKPAQRVRIGPFQQRGDAEAARLRAQQLRSDMPANVVALDAATPAPEGVASSPKAPAPATAAPPSPHASPAASGKTPVVAAPPSSEKPSPAAAAHGYAIQIGAYGAQAQADAMRDKLRAAGFVAYSEKVQTESGVRWRLRVGPVADRDGASRLQGELKAKVRLDGIVVTYP